MKSEGLAQPAMPAHTRVNPVKEECGMADGPAEKLDEDTASWTASETASMVLEAP